MTDIQRVYFEALNIDRAESANMLEKPSMSGIQRSVVEKYSDQAHFIYELLQNADDVGATSAEFILYPDKLIFKHNGTRHFFVTDPLCEQEDTRNGTLGDLNAITSVANSNKQKASIGKFGVGFKAVFQYTSTPHIYDPDFWFRIERFIVPVELEADYPGRKPGETIFVFPFDHPERSTEEAYDDISSKLRGLVYPNLFLNCLKDISYEIDDVVGLYAKKCIETKVFEEITADKIHLEKNEGEEIIGEDLWLFSQKDEDSHKHSIGFFVGDDNRIKPVNMPAFCFFPTKEVTNLTFIMHAPFLLTDSREGIKAGDAYNRRLIACLAKLAADSLKCLKNIGEEHGVRIIDDSILDVVPINEKAFTAPNDKSSISFLPFYSELRNALADGLLPTESGYVSSEHAYWSDTIEIIQVFPDTQLGQLLDDPEARWVFRSYGRNTTGHNAREGLQSYIDSLTCDWINEGDINRNLSSWFISQQTEDWLHVFYEWLGNVSRRFQNFKSKPIFLDADGNPAAAYDKMGERTLFLPSIAVTDCPTIKQSLLENEYTKHFILDTVKLEEPSLRDYIYNTIIPLYSSNEAIDTESHFRLFFTYYCECKHEEAANLIAKIKKLEFLRYYDAENDTYYRETPSSLYYPNDMLKAYFETKPSTKFLALSDYEGIIGSDERKLSSLHIFFDELGVKRTVGYITRELTWSEAKQLPYRWARSNGVDSWIESAPDGSAEILESILETRSQEKSLLLWNVLVSLIPTCTGSSSLFSGKHRYHYYTKKAESYITDLERKIKSAKWLINITGEFCAPTEVSASELSKEYDTESESAVALMGFLGVESDDQGDAPGENRLTEEEKADLELAQRLRSAGLDNEKMVADFLEYMRRTKERKQSDSKDPSGKKHDNQITPIIEDIENRVRQKSSITPTDPFPVQLTEEPAMDVDEFNPPVVDYQKQIERKKEQSTEEIEKIAHMQELQETALSATRYSFLWFKTLLDMEILNGDKDSINSREINISFERIEQEPGKQRTLVLNHPNKYIPQYMEELTDIPLVLHMNDGSKKTIAIEVVSVKSYTLSVKLRKNAELEGVDLSAVRECTIKAARPVFLLDELRKALAKLGFDDDFNMKDHLPSNLEFIFGPPGTGKTTYLANNVLIPFMKEQSDIKVLVLTPTNKAADVITTKIMDGMGTDTSYMNWLVRFGLTGLEEIEASPVYRDKTYDIRQMRRSIVITTVARFPYDYFMPSGDKWLYLRDLDWDYIVFDEASMIPVVDIIYPLYKRTPSKFIIAGDPFQIEPVTTVDLWKDENVYSLVNLKSFVNPETEPKQYAVKTLTTQYRSVPEIGGIFSRFAYGGILQHYRDTASRRKLNLDEYLDIEPLNIIKFPVSKYESIYKAKRLNGTTPYQVYSAIFTMEFTCYISNKLAENNPEETFRIGVVAPYKAQASLIDKLLVAERLPNSVGVQVGTIHGFQGDECDIVLAVLNPPPSISSSDRLFLNKQNILNVAISRARDYLFLIMPDDNTDKINNLNKVKQIERLMRQSGTFTEYDAHMIEDAMFGSPTYIEDNSFATSHQTVNVYGQPEMIYEIRSEDTAVDVQVHY